MLKNIILIVYIDTAPRFTLLSSCLFKVSPAKMASLLSEH